MTSYINDRSIKKNKQAANALLRLKCAGLHFCYTLKNVTLKQKNPAIIKMYLRFQDEKVVFVLIRGDVVIDVRAHNCINTLTQPQYPNVNCVFHAVLSNRKVHLLFLFKYSSVLGYRFRHCLHTNILRLQ